MPCIEIDIESLVDQLTMIGLVSREQHREARAEAEDGSGEAVLRVLLRKGWLTSWQLERLKKGDPSGFFFGDVPRRSSTWPRGPSPGSTGASTTSRHAAWRSRCCGSGSP